MNNKNILQTDPRIEFFDCQAANWDNEGPDSQTAIGKLESIGDLLAFSAGQKILEVGCGTGKLTNWLAGQVAPGKVLAVDFSQPMLDKAIEKNIPAEFRCLDVCRDDLGEGIYDIVFCFHCFPHFRDQLAALKNLSRTLKPTGRLIVMHLVGSAQINAFHAGVGGAVADDLLPVAEQWDDLLAGANLKCEKLIDRDDLFFLNAVR